MKNSGRELYPNAPKSAAWLPLSGNYRAMSRTGCQSAVMLMRPCICRTGAGKQIFTDEMEGFRIMRNTDADQSRHFFRSQERLFCFNSQWYFATREGDCGPFPTKDIARTEVSRYINERAALRGFQDSRTPGVNGHEDLPADLSLALVPMEVLAS